MKPGQKVVCIKSSKAKEAIKGEIYTIKDIIYDDFGNTGLALYEIEPIQDEPDFNYTGFNFILFRLVDYTFGEIIAEFIEEIILEES